MVRYSFFLLLLVSQFSHASWIKSFEDGQKMALASHRFMIVDFWATWCGPCQKMDFESWNNPEVNQLLNAFVQVKIDIDMNRELAQRYGIESIPNMFIMDGNGKVVHSFDGYHDAEALKKELAQFAFSTEFLSRDLLNYFTMKNYNTSLRVFQKYLDYSLLVDGGIKDKILKIGDSYLSDATNALSKKDSDYAEKKQKLMLLKLFELAYDMKFEKISKKLSDIKAAEVYEGNKDYYTFLRFLSSKAMKSDDFTSVEAESKNRPGFESYVEKANFILSKRAG